MGIADRVLSAAGKVPCFMHPEAPGFSAPSDIFVFQFWPQTVTIDYTPNYAEKQIPGASHPLYQWISGGGRSITFQAQFVSEVDVNFADLLRLTDAGAAAAVEAARFTPSEKYIVDVGAALARLQSYMMPTYLQSGANKGRAVAPPRMKLYFPGMSLGGGSANKGIDEVLTILRSAPITIQSCHPDGSPKLAEVSLQFAEVIQSSRGTGSAIRYVDRKDFEKRGKRYRASVFSQHAAETFALS